MEAKRIIFLDDVCYTLTVDDSIGEEEIKFSCSFEYDEAVKCVLSEKQLYDYTGDIEREFKVSEKKIQEVRNYLEKSIWREH